MRNKKNNKILTDREKLQLLYVEFLKLNHKTVSMKFDYIAEAGKYVKSNLAKYMFKLYGFTGLPQVVSDEDYEKLQAREIFRGIENLEYHAELLCSEEYYQSYWHNGIGIFCTTKSEWAEDFFTSDKGADYVIKFKYTGKTLDRINDKLTKMDYQMALKTGNCKDIKDEDIIKKIQAFREFMNDKQTDVPNVRGIGREFAKHRGKQAFEESIITDDSFMPIYLGFDCFDFDINKYRRPEIVIQNRGKIVISLSEYNRICNASKNYKHCIKTEADLTTETQQELSI